MNERTSFFFKHQITIELNPLLPLGCLGLSYRRCRRSSGALVCLLDAVCCPHQVEDVQRKLFKTPEINNNDDDHHHHHCLPCTGANGSWHCRRLLYVCLRTKPMYWDLVSIDFLRALPSARPYLGSILSPRCMQLRPAQVALPIEVVEAGARS